MTLGRGGLGERLPDYGDVAIDVLGPQSGQQPIALPCVPGDRVLAVVRWLHAVVRVAARGCDHAGPVGLRDQLEAGEHRAEDAAEVLQVGTFERRQCPES
jgi:hypothetical protein